MTGTAAGFGACGCWGFVAPSMNDRPSKTTLTSIDTTKADRWVYLDQQISGETGVQNFQFTTPVNVASDQRCGKVVFSDMHVSAGSTSSAGTPYPGGCNTGLTPQEKALAFMFFDIASCVGQIF